MNDGDELGTTPKAVDDDRDELLDRALRAVRDDAPEVRREADAAATVRRELAKVLETFGVSDYRSLIPDYLAGRLGDAQVLLFEQELKESIPLRRALETARTGAKAGRHAVPPAAAGESDSGPSRSRIGLHRRWPLAVAAAAVAAVGAVLVVPMLTTPEQARLARVDHVQGSIYRAGATSWVPLSVGDWVAGRQKLATKMDATAVLALDDGSRMEIGPRSQLAMTRQRDGNRVRIDRGRVIIQAAPQGSGRFDVATDDLVVAVKGTIFEVSHGTKGSRVSVIEGEVEVQRGSERTSLRAGDQLGTRKTATAGVEESIAWSKDADRYVEMLRSYAALKREIESVLTTTRRHSTRLLDLAPAQSRVYLGVPNAPATIADAYGVMQSFGTRVLGREPKVPVEYAWVDELQAWLGKVGDHIGDETVVAVAWDDERPVAHLLLAEIQAPGLRQLIEELLPSFTAAAGGSGAEIEIVDDPAEARAGVLSIWFADGILAVANSPRLLKELEAVVGGAKNPFLDTELYASLRQVYDRGAEYLGGVDLVAVELGSALPSGPLLDLSGALTAVVEYRQEHERAAMTVEVRFDGDDSDRIPWLDRPGPMGALDLYSPDAQLAGAFVVRSPHQLLGMLPQSIRAAFEEAEALVVVEELLGALGGEVAVGVDGPLLPVPSWKAVVEVYDRVRMQASIQSLAEAIAARSGSGEFGVEVVDEVDVPDRLYRLTLPGMSAYYAYVDGYLVAAPSRALVEHARQVHASGVTLLGAPKFQQLLPLDTYVDFSAIGFLHLSQALVAALELAGLTDGPAFEEAYRELAGTTLLGVYNEPDRVRVVTNGLNVLPLIGLPLLPGFGDVVSADKGDGA